ncbi:pyridoxal phosphate-dependent aminotransferase [Methylobrevis albus]|uniref:aspartate transaminase n=1 Tax=Methylobrevis albus TaxID=2793297 RepID=A0A931MZ89_9HYPH|nr:pyridoxal phosphate-dependent aminotransferase [Methylobrevis albus]MBH0239227.1 pyridoxal phosphate-dependent aminotransferase [Methylobrevis albus]
MLSKRSAVEPFRAMDVMSAAFALERQGRSIIHMEVGEPGAPTPRVVREAAMAAIASGRVRYTEALGTPALRARIATHYAERYGVAVSPERVVVATGSSAAFNLAFLAFFDPGDRIGMPTPGYPAYRNILAALGLEVVEIPTGPETRWAVTPEMLAEIQRDRPLKGLIVASPANPSGTMIQPPALKALVESCDALGIRLIMDEIYHGLVYGGETATALAFTEQAVVVNSFSKYYCMTGWRVGWMVVPQPAVRAIECIAQNLSISVNSLSQTAALAAFDAVDELELVKAGYAANRELLLRRLPEAGLDDVLPVDGAFYIYANVRKFTNDSMDFARRMLTEAGVATTPGLDFDPARGAGYIRLSFAGTTPEMDEAVTRIAGWIGR